MPGIPGPLLNDFYTGQAQNTYAGKLDYAEKLLVAILDYVNFFHIPTWYRNGIKINTDADFFGNDGRRLFYGLMGEFSSLGLDQRDLTAWRKLKQPQALSQNQIAQPSMPNGEGEQKKGFFAKIVSVPGSMLGVISPPPLEEAAAPVVEEPFETVLDLYSEGLVMVENFGEGQASYYLNEIRIAVDKHLTRLLRKIRTSTNEHLMEIGEQIARR